MASLFCINNKFESGNFGSDSGNVVIPSENSPFPITSYGTLTAAGIGAATFLGIAPTFGIFSGVGSSTVSFDGSGSTSGTFASAGVGVATFVSTSNKQAMLHGAFINLTSSGNQRMLPEIFINEG